MFSSEFAVQIQFEGFGTVSLFADKSLIRTAGDTTYLRVTLVGENGKPRHKTVLLPSECFETGSRWLSVPGESLLAA